MPIKLEFPREYYLGWQNWLEKAWRWMTKFKHYQLAVSGASSVSANTTSEQTFTVTGLATTDVIISVNKPTHQAGLGIVNARVSAVDTIAITYMNTTGGGITPTSETYEIVVVRKD